MHQPTMDFGYNPPTGPRSMEKIIPSFFSSDLEKTLNIASNGFKSIWISDHLNYTDEFRLECWTLLTWIAAKFPQFHLGTIVMCNSFRNPSLMAKMAATIQHLSNNKLILGYGAGWYEEEYKAFGFEYPKIKIRTEMLAEATQIMKMLWNKKNATFEGKYYQIKSANCEPKPKTPPPIMIGGGGEKFTLKVVAKHADWWNDLSRPIEEAKHKLKVLKTHCVNEGTNFKKIRKTMTARIFVDKSHSKAQEKIKSMGLYIENPPIAGDPVYITEKLTEIAELGFDLCVAVLEDFQNQEDMKLFSEKVIPNFKPTENNYVT
ncbi:MAG: LLM class flavin-dependent oxidoreductase [SAR202 cluster bacterium]|nr:LLM class flavin-dependent oxidoreductase [SAR202 cluster bacterium]